jgi:hypothetical protein
MKPIARSLSLTLLSLLPLLASPAAATTFQRVEDTSLTDQAQAVVHARVVDIEPSTLGDRPATDYIVEVERVLKGDIPGSTIVVRVPGGFQPNGVGLKIWGAPAMTAGENALLFLAPGEDGTFRILHLMLGAFHRRSGLALRDLSEAQEVRPDGVGPATDEVREFDRFADWISDRAAGIVRARDYVVAGQAGQPRSAVEAFTLMKWEDGHPIRWFNFDTGQSVAWRVHVGGQPGLGLDASIAAFRVGLDAWNNDGGSNIRYTYAGTTPVGTGFSDTDNINSILFDDPGDAGSEGAFDCGSGGVIAVGGPWFDEATRLYKGKPYHATVEGDIITNDGTNCFFEGNPSAAEEVFAHELGHTLGISHSRTPDALMAARAHNDRRGARLHADDRAAVAELYGGGTTPGGGGPKAPNKLVAQSITATSVVLTWKDNAKNETEFRIERKTGTGKFTEIQTLPANTTQVTISGLNPGTAYSFRVRAGNASGLSTYTNVVKIRTRAAGGTLAAPEGLTAVPRSATQVLLAWRDVSSGEVGVRVERSVAGGSYQELTRSAAADATSLMVRGLAPGTTYRFRVWAVGADGARSPYSAEVSVTTPPI